MLLCWQGLYVDSCCSLTPNIALHFLFILSTLLKLAGAENASLQVRICSPRILKEPVNPINECFYPYCSETNQQVMICSRA
jgi:hypothetical protein